MVRENKTEDNVILLGTSLYLFCRHVRGDVNAGFLHRKRHTQRKKKKGEKKREKRVQKWKRKGKGREEKKIMLGFLFPLFHRQTVRTCVCMRDD